MDGKKEIADLLLDMRVRILQQIIMENNAKECALIAESRKCQNELLQIGAEAYPPFPKHG